MADAQLGFRTITRAFITRKYFDESGILQEAAIALPLPPESAEINPGVSLEKIKTKQIQGPTTTALTYKNETEPELRMTFGLGGPQIEQMIHGQVVVADTSYTAPVYFEFKNKPGVLTVPARAAGVFGYDVAAQDPLVSNAIAYYIDPDTKLAVDLELIAFSGTPSGNQFAIGANLQIKVSSTLAATGYNVYGRVDGSFPTLSRMSSEEMSQVGVTLLGVNFDGKARVFTARFCSLLYGTSLSAEPQREVSLQILPDPEDGTGTGYQIIDLPDKVAA